MYGLYAFLTTSAQTKAFQFALITCYYNTRNCQQHVGTSLLEQKTHIGNL